MKGTCDLCYSENVRINDDDGQMCNVCMLLDVRENTAHDEVKIRDLSIAVRLILKALKGREP